MFSVFKSQDSLRSFSWIFQKGQICCNGFNSNIEFFQYLWCCDSIGSIGALLDGRVGIRTNNFLYLSFLISFGHRGFITSKVQCKIKSDGYRIQVFDRIGCHNSQGNESIVHEVLMELDRVVFKGIENSLLVGLSELLTDIEYRHKKRSNIQFCQKH